jgi:hypothetical protein
MRCEFCCTTLVKRASTGDRHCPSCELYNAAVAGLKAAADSIARNRQPKAKDAWLNEYGVFAWVDGVVMQLGSPEETAPFVALTKAATRVTAFLDETQMRGAAA